MATTVRPFISSKAPHLQWSRSGGASPSHVVGAREPLPVGPFFILDRRQLPVSACPLPVALQETGLSARFPCAHRGCMPWRWLSGHYGVVLQCASLAVALPPSAAGRVEQPGKLAVVSPVGLCHRPGGFPGVRLWYALPSKHAGLVPSNVSRSIHSETQTECKACGGPRLTWKLAWRTEGKQPQQLLLQEPEVSLSLHEDVRSP